MTDKYPEVLATADLTPISPAPLHPSSPIIVPTLQHQADTICTMTLSGEYQAAAASAALADQLQLDPATRSDMSATNRQYGFHEVDTSSTRDPDLNHPSNHITEGQGGGASPARSAGEGTRPSNVQQEENIERQPDTVSKTNESTLNSDTSAASLTNHTEVAALAHDLHPPSPHQLAPEPSADSSPQTYQEVQKPQEEEQAGSSTDDSQPPQPSTDALPSTSDQTSSASNDDAIDIQALVDNITARAAAADATQNTTSQNTANMSTTSQSSSLPPRPPMPQPAPQSYTRPEDAATYPPPGVPHPSAMTVPPAIPPAPGTYPPGGTPGTVASASATFPTNPPPSVTALSNHAMSMPQYDSAYAGIAGSHAQAFDSQQQRWDGFLQEERRYVSEAKWDRFPDGSRLFIGNLSSERVSKKEVFDIFSKFGRLAQISLKQAYGFVQYHTVAEGQVAMDNLQGIEIRGRKIHLEFSRAQKKDGDGDKRSNRGKRDGDRHDGGRGRRDDYRPSRQPSPRRGSHRQQNSYDSSRGRGYHDGGFNVSRGRSQSPSYGRRNSDPYRRRSPSPYRRHRSEAELDMPRRYGGDIPDVQFLLLQDVERRFISWAEQAFIDQGLKVHVMFLNPQFPRDAVIQRQVMEGVHAVVELDYRASQCYRIPLQVFDRSAGHNNVRYDQYQDLEPHVAAQLVVRTKSQAQLQSPYGHGQFPPIQQPYAQAPQPPYMPPAYPNQPYANLTAGPVPTAGSVDNATLQKILGSLQGQPGAPQVPGQPIPSPGGGQMDVNAILAGFGGPGNAAPPGPPPQAYGGGYTQMPPNGGDSAQHVQNIMAQLSRYRQ